jgi:hypothetical protein
MDIEMLSDAAGGISSDRGINMQFQLAELQIDEVVMWQSEADFTGGGKSSQWNERSRAAGNLVIWKPSTYIEFNASPRPSVAFFFHIV